MATKNFGNGRAIYGSQKAAVTPPDGSPQGSPAGTYMFKNIKRGVFDAKRQTYTDEMNNEDGQSFHGVIPTGTATMQFTTADQPAPLQYSTVPLKQRGVADPDTFIIWKLGETYDAGGETLMDVELALDVDP